MEKRGRYKIMISPIPGGPGSELCRTLERIRGPPGRGGRRRRWVPDTCSPQGDRRAPQLSDPQQRHELRYILQRHRTGTMSSCTRRKAGRATLLQVCQLDSLAPKRGFVGFVGFVGREGNL